MIYRINHRTTYHYDAPVTASFGRIYQLPGDQDGQHCVTRTVTVDPEPEVISERLDYFGNLVATCMIRTEHRKLSVVSESEVDTGGRGRDAVTPDGDSWSEVSWDDHRARLVGDGDLPAVEFTLDSPLIRRSRTLGRYAEESFRPGRSLDEATLDLCHRINTDFTFDTKATKVDTPLETVLEKRRGVCQDFTHIMIGGLRSIGIPAAYVSGYLETEPPPGRPRLVGVDRTHAWVGVYLGGGAWVGVDPTNDQVAGERYVTTARGRDYGDVPPLKGVIFTEAEETRLDVAVDVAAGSTGTMVR